MIFKNMNKKSICPACQEPIPTGHMDIVICKKCGETIWVGDDNAIVIWDKSMDKQNKENKND
jgi:Fe2+ or Zn2+ uptake regulation protein